MSREALGLNHLVQDTDGDGVVDGNEYYAFSSRNVFSHDSDNDSVPNWLDEDSDNDGIKDTFEKTTDLDADKLPAFKSLKRFTLDDARAQQICEIVDDLLSGGRVSLYL